MAKKRVVVSGLGALSSLGIGMEKTWDGLVQGRSGIAPVQRFDASDYPTRFAGECRDYREEDHFPKVEGKKLDLFTQYALVAADEALKDSGLQLDRCDPERIGCVAGSGIGGIHELEEMHSVLLERGPKRISPHFIPKLMVNAMSGQISIKYGLRGTNFVCGSACASAGHAIGMAFRSLQYGEADVILSGGAETAITPLGLAGFCALKALSRRNDNPQGASRPFDAERDGFVMGDGAAIVVLEELEHARRRGAKIYAEVLGFGSTADAFHITAPQEDGVGPARAMALALKDAELAPEQVDYTNAHGPSTPYNDAVETTAIKKVFGDHARRLAVSSTKSMVGHLLGASAALEFAALAMTVRHNVVHPTLNLEHPDPACDLDYVPGSARDVNVRYAISNSLGFGGHNVCLAIGKLA
ncbi:MAG: beta-ketoacyl-ACP synthase II [Planctomycetes bacterium]|nr:beta-ketoacyl-ACP synthase II [Planctomycetota bacterium]